MIDNTFTAAGWGRGAADEQLSTDSISPEQPEPVVSAPIEPVNETAAVEPTVLSPLSHLSLWRTKAAEEVEAEYKRSYEQIVANHPHKVLLAVPTRGYPWYESANALAPYNPQYVREKLSVASARNRIVRDFLKTEADALVMCDDDVIPPEGFMEMLAGCPYDVVGAPVPIAKMPAHEVFLNVFTVDPDGRIHTIKVPESGHIEVDSIGSGLILIRRHVLEHPEMTRPFDQQFDKDGVILVGQDLMFCKRVKELGFTVGVCMEAMCDHFVSLHANAIAMAYRGERGESGAEKEKAA